ncbi:metal ABC transporter permease [Spirulina sp. CS-785/01]|uniref:metal ABC transporter permease n=1 Tax=Spirulina sp. CS-785/01 TaxID=3021716 RepID=UPI00232D91AE|nr:metal ABC transporter permease [Spirulina sp. CS-785/01]MDB9315722.1 metal ABC transporter permease [Spirulina sp. CS-785/01]
MQNALFAGVLTSIASGIIGSFVVINRIVFIAGGIAHAAYGGVGMGFFFGFNPVLGAIGFSVFAALGMGIVETKTKLRGDTVIGMLWAIGMAIGVIFVDLTEGYTANLRSYLFGSILAVSKQDLGMMLLLDMLIVVLVIAFYKEFLAISFDDTFARLRNVPVDSLYLLLMVMIALTTAMLMRIVGVILLIALLSMPAAIANLYVQNLKKMILLAIGLCLSFTIAGLALSYILNLTSGATIVLCAAIAYLISLGINGIHSTPLPPKA